MRLSITTVNHMCHWTRTIHPVQPDPLLCEPKFAWTQSEAMTSLRDSPVFSTEIGQGSPSRDTDDTRTGDDVQLASVVELWSGSIFSLVRVRVRRSIIDNCGHVSASTAGWMGEFDQRNDIIRRSIGGSRSTEIYGGWGHGRGSTCTRFDYRSCFEDRLIASSVDEELGEEGRVGSRVPAAAAETTCRLPPGIPE